MTGRQSQFNYSGQQSDSIALSGSSELPAPVRACTDDPEMRDAHSLLRDYRSALCLNECRGWSQVSSSVSAQPARPLSTSSTELMTPADFAVPLETGDGPLVLSVGPTHRSPDRHGPAQHYNQPSAVQQQHCQFDSSGQATAGWSRFPGAQYPSHEQPYAAAPEFADAQQHRHPEGSSQATEADLLKLFSRLGTFFNSSAICDSLARQLEVDECESHQTFVESFGQTHSSERTDFALISSSILRHWNKEIVKPKRWTVEKRVENLWKALKELPSTLDLSQKCSKLWQDICGRRMMISGGQLFHVILKQSDWTSGRRAKPRRSRATPSNDSSDLLKLFDSFSRNFNSFGMCDSLATELEVNGIGQGYVRQFQMTRPDEQSHFPAIACDILKHWNREVAKPKGWSLAERLDYLWDVLQIVRCNLPKVDLSQACYDKWKAISAHRDGSR